MQRIDHRLHRAALVLAEELDFDRAARRLQLSVPELKERIARLESTLNLVLFEQYPNQVALTALGRLYLEQVRKSRLF